MATQQAQTGKNPRFSRPHEDRQWPQGAGPPAAKGRVKLTVSSEPQLRR
nr:hypothetical protein [Meiothermus taiwanensis]